MLSQSCTIKNSRHSAKEGHILSFLKGVRSNFAQNQSEQEQLPKVYRSQCRNFSIAHVNGLSDIKQHTNGKGQGIDLNIAFQNKILLEIFLVLEKIEKNTENTKATAAELIKHS